MARCPECGWKQCLRAAGRGRDDKRPSPSKSCGGLKGARVNWLEPVHGGVGRVQCVLVRAGACWCWVAQARLLWAAQASGVNTLPDQATGATTSALWRAERWSLTSAQVLGSPELPR